MSEQTFLATDWEAETLNRIAAYAKVMQEARKLANLLEKFAPGIFEEQRVALRTALDEAYSVE